MAQTFTQALFWECRNQKHLDAAQYTVKHSNIKKDGKVYFSMYQEYLRIGDLTEFEFVDQIFDGNWVQWEKIQESKALEAVGLDTSTWATALEKQIKSSAIKRVIKDMNDDGSKTAPASAKWIAEGKYKEIIRVSPKSQKAKAQEEKNNTLEGETADLVKSDMERLGLN